MPTAGAVPNVVLSNNQSYILPPRHHVEADAIIVRVLLDRILASVPGRSALAQPCRPSIIDLGAGVGQYGHALLAEEPQIAWRGYDGAGNVGEVTDGFVSFADLTIPLSLPRADWVMALEVGEHIPNRHEMMIVRNLHAHNCRGILLSWASPWQSGRGHVNNHASDYLIRTFRGLGYRLRRDLTAAVRAHKVRALPHADRPRNVYDYFANNAIVLEREKPCACRAKPLHGRGRGRAATA